MDALVELCTSYCWGPGVHLRVEQCRWGGRTDLLDFSEVGSQVTSCEERVPQTRWGGGHDVAQGSTVLPTESAVP